MVEAPAVIEFPITPLDAVALVDALETRERIVGFLTNDQQVLLIRLRRAVGLSVTPPDAGP